MANEMVKIQAKDGGTFDAYLATPPSGSGPALVLIQEIFGINNLLRYQADCYAAQGFTVLVPDLFWRQKPGVQLTDKTQEDWNAAFELMQGMDQDKAIEDIDATLAEARKRGNGKVGVVGWCLGGRLAYLTAARCTPDAAVGYYGVMLGQSLDEAANIKTPLMLHIASEDEYVPKEEQEQIKAGLAGNDKVTVHVYEGQNHAFARPMGDNYDQAAARIADQRTLDFLKANLGL